MRVTLFPAGRGLSRLREQDQRPLVALSALVVVVRRSNSQTSATARAPKRPPARPETGDSASRSAPVAMRAWCGCTWSKAWSSPRWVACSPWAWRAGACPAVLSMLPLAAPPDALAFRADARGAGVLSRPSLLVSAPPGPRTGLEGVAGRSRRLGNSAPAMARIRRLAAWAVARRVPGRSVRAAARRRRALRADASPRVASGSRPIVCYRCSVDTRSDGYGRGAGWSAPGPAGGSRDRMPADCITALRMTVTARRRAPPRPARSAGPGAADLSATVAGAARIQRDL